jgi:hypothetical protein
MNERITNLLRLVLIDLERRRNLKATPKRTAFSGRHLRFMMLSMELGFDE